MQPLISVIVPVWNVEKYLRRCVESIINQTYSHLEIILVDDGSPDNSGAICDEYAKKDDRIKVIHKENGGLVSARKAGIIASSGEYIGFVDSDDWIDEGMYQHMMDNMIKHKVEVVSVSNHIEYPDKTVKDKSRISGVYSRFDLGEKSSYNNMFYLDEINIGYITPSIWSKLFKRSIIENYYLNIPIKNYMEDSACVYGCIPFLDYIYISNEPYYHYNQTNENSICKKSKDNLFVVNDIMNCYSHLFNLYQTHEAKSELTMQLDKFILKMLLTALPSSINDRLLTYRFPVEMLPRNKNIVVYGAGKVGVSYYYQFKRSGDVSVISIIDKGKAGTKLDGATIDNIDVIKQKEFDVIIIAVLREDIACEIHKELVDKYNIPKNKILWEKPIHIVDEIMI